MILASLVAFIVGTETSIEESSVQKVQCSHGTAARTGLGEHCVL
jgi:hypothetical protein